MQRIFFTVLLIVFSSISLFGQIVTKEEYEVYAFVLKEIYKDEIKSDGKLQYLRQKLFEKLKLKDEMN